MSNITTKQRTSLLTDEKLLAAFVSRITSVLSGRIAGYIIAIVTTAFVTFNLTGYFMAARVDALNSRVAALELDSGKVAMVEAKIDRVQGDLELIKSFFGIKPILVTSP